MPPKTAVLLIQLGTPDSPSVGDVARYLGEFLNDRRVIDIPWLFRRLLVNGIIVPFRSPKSAKIYRTLWDMSGGKSPLLTHSLKVKSLLAQRFSGEGVTIEMAMRYQKPSLTETLCDLGACDRLVGVDRWSSWPASVQGLPRLGWLKKRRCCWPTSGAARARRT